MTTLSEDQVNALFEEHRVKFPEMQEKIAELQTYYSTKMWH